MISRMYRVLYLVINRRSGRRESPVTREGDRKAGRSAYMEQLGSADSVLAIKLRTESCLQVYLPWSRYDLQLETMCCSVSDWRQKEHADDCPINHLRRFLPVAKVLVKYLKEKLKTFLGIFCWTVDQRLVTCGDANLIIDEIMKPWGVNSCSRRPSCCFWTTFKTCFILL